MLGAFAVALMCLAPPSLAKVRRAGSVPENTSRDGARPVGLNWRANF